VVEKKFARTFSEIFEAYKEALIERGLMVDDRILRNYTILAAVVWIFQKHTKADFAINPEMFRDRCLTDAIEQSEKIRSSDALGTFWKMISSLIQEQQITRMDYDIREVLSEMTVHKKAGEKEIYQVDFDKPTRVLYLDFDRAHAKYSEAHRKIFGSNGLASQTMIDYARNHFSYIGLKASHYFSGSSGKRTSAHMFNYNLLVERRVFPDIDSPIDDETVNKANINNKETKQNDFKEPSLFENNKKSETKYIPRGNEGDPF
jgi:hypothetical protein